MLDSQEFSPIASSSEKKNYTSKRRNNRRKKTKRKSSSKKKSYSLPSFNNETNYLDDIKKLLGGAKKMSAEEIVWFIFMSLMVIIFLLRHFANNNKLISDYISNWFDASVKSRESCSNGIFMCAVKDIISGFGKSNKESKDKLYHLLTLILIVLFTTELWMHMLRTLSKSENASHPKFCLLGIRCFI